MAIKNINHEEDTHLTNMLFCSVCSCLTINKYTIDSLEELKTVNLLIEQCKSRPSKYLTSKTLA